MKTEVEIKKETERQLIRDAYRDGYYRGFRSRKTHKGFGEGYDAAMNLKWRHSMLKSLDEIMEQREVMAGAFLQQTGLKPDEVEQVIEPSGNGGVRWFIQRRGACRPS